MPLPGGPHEQDAFLIQCANGDRDAARLLKDFALAARYADNIVDKYDTSLVPSLLFKALVDIPGNPFFRANYQTLAAPITEAIAAWQLSDEFRTSGLWLCLARVNRPAGGCGGANYRRHQPCRQRLAGSLRNLPRATPRNT
jgi:hypothetical protein